MKRAFCEPGNVQLNPPLVLARDIALEIDGKIEVRPNFWI
jgi:hypothetical protein